MIERLKNSVSEIIRKFPREMRNVFLLLLIQLGIILLKVLDVLVISWEVALIPVLIQSSFVLLFLLWKLVTVLFSPFLLYIELRDEKENKQLEEMMNKRLEESHKLLQEHFRSGGNERIRCKGGNFEILLDEDKESR